MKRITLLGMVLLLILFFLLILLGFFKIVKSGDLSYVDAISYQISLLELIITAVTLGGGVLAFFGWKEIKDSLEKRINKEVDSISAQFSQDKVHEIVNIVIEKIKKEDDSSDANTVLEQSNIFNVNEQDVKRLLFKVHNLSEQKKRNKKTNN